MFHISRIVLGVFTLLSLAAVAFGQCPGYNPSSNTNLACAIATTSPSQSTAPALGTTVGATMATQLSQLPIVTAVSSAGLVFDPSIGTFRVSQDLGPIFTQRGDTIGRHAALLSLTYQRFNFDEVDGIDLKHLGIVNAVSSTQHAFNDMRVDFRVDQFVAVGTYGLTNRVDVSFVLPFSWVTLKSQRSGGSASGGSAIYTDGSSVATSYLAQNFFPGSASGIGDVIAAVKANVYRSSSEKTTMAVGGQVRFPTGDSYNYLGSGAYGFKPYFVMSHNMGRFTPNFGVSYQWNSASALNNNQNLPSTVGYSGGVEIRAAKRFSVSGEFLGQYVINGPQLQPVSVPVGGTNLNLSSVQQYVGSYAMDNVSVGFKANPWRGLYLAGSVMFKLDDAGLRANYVPMFAIAYRFGR